MHDALKTSRILRGGLVLLLVDWLGVVGGDLDVCSSVAWLVGWLGP